MGIILYELFMGMPPFYSDSIYSLVKVIVRNRVRYSARMSDDFKSFLQACGARALRCAAAPNWCFVPVSRHAVVGCTTQGLLRKDPVRRLSWPELLDHPFVRVRRESVVCTVCLCRSVRLCVSLPLSLSLFLFHLLCVLIDASLATAGPRAPLAGVPHTWRLHTPRAYCGQRRSNGRSLRCGLSTADAIRQRCSRCRRMGANGTHCVDCTFSSTGGSTDASSCTCTCTGTGTGTCTGTGTGTFCAARSLAIPSPVTSVCEGATCGGCFPTLEI